MLETIYKIAGILTALGVCFVAFQVYLTQKQIKADHERSRRERSVEYLIHWAQKVSAMNSSIRRIAESLDAENSRLLINNQAFSVLAKYEEDLASIFSEQNLEKDISHVKLTNGQSAKIRTEILGYMNLLEAILVGWQYSIVDRKIIEGQFSYLFSPEQGHYILENLRTAAGGEKSFPAMTIFAAHLEEQRRNSLIRKANVDS